MRSIAGFYIYLQWSLLLSVNKTLKENNKMNGKNARIIGFITVLSYVANYFLRNMLSVLTPSILNSTSYTKEYLALLSSVYMIAYAAGQFLNGVLGEIFKPKSMVLTGLLASGAATVLFPFVKLSALQVGCFFVLGYSLSMLRGPLMKIISENTKPNHARVICVFFSFSSFAGPLIASLIAMLFNWRGSFVAAGLCTVAVGVGAYLSLSVLENRGIISFNRLEKVTPGALLGVFKIENIAFYLIIACLVEIAAASISFWIPTFLNEYIRLDEDRSNLVFSFISLVRAVIPFVALALFKLMGERDVLIIRLAYGISFAAFVCMLAVPKGFSTVVMLLLALVMNSIVSALLWSIYIPGLGKTGRVSSINGILDCTGYVAASAATTAFAHVVTSFGWAGLIVSWSAIPVIGIVSSLGRGKQK